MAKKTLASSSLYNENLNLKDMDNGILLVTKNHSTLKDFKKFEKAKSSDSGGFNVYRSKDAYELWCNKELIGYCDFSIQVETPEEYAKEVYVEEDFDEFVEENKNTLFVSTNLEIVYLLEKYQGKGVGSYFSGIIREDLNSKVLEMVIFQKSNKCRKIEIEAHAEYHSEDGGLFHRSLHSDLDSYISNLVKDTYDINLELAYQAGY
jgi:GNAT superfamily N-acetyltransferase